MDKPKTLKTKILAIGIILVIVVVGLISWAYIANSPSHKVQKVINSHNQLTQISYHGQNGVNALTLLERHAKIKTKHYSFGDFVVSINGVAGNGPKYWTFYVNGKQAQVGAGAYKTKSSDVIAWKLQ